MEHVGNSSESSAPTYARAQRTAAAAAPAEHGDAYLYILIVMSFYGVFLCGIMVGYFHSKRKEKRRTNVFTRLVHEEEEREWGALPRKHSFPSFAGAAAAAACPSSSSSSSAGPRCVQVPPLPFCGSHGNHLGHLRHEGALPSPLACALCTEQSSVSSLCSSADTRFAIEEESDSGTAEGPDENLKGSENSGDDSG